MTGGEFSQFLDAMGWTNLEAAKALHLGRNTISRYRHEGTPRTVDFACAAIAAGLRPMGELEIEAVQNEKISEVSRADLEALKELVDKLVSGG